MDEKETVLDAIKQSIKDDICECRGIRRGTDDGLERMRYLLSIVIDVMQSYGIKDFEISGNEYGVHREIRFVVRMLESYFSDFFELLRRYESLEEGNKESDEP